jgi:hypothetical protein
MLIYYSICGFVEHLERDHLHLGGLATGMKSQYERKEATPNEIIDNYFT